MADTKPREGTVGNLTPEHEEKLKEFWRALMRVAGVETDATASDAGSDAGNGAADESTTSPEKKKKKRFGVFRRSRDTTHDDATMDDDKHGQTKEFKQALRDMTPEELRQTIWSFTKGDDPDSLMLRFLRARKWVVQDALVMLVATAHWRAKDIHIDDEILLRGEEHFAELEKSGKGTDKQLGKDFMAQLRRGKSIIHGVDKAGRPITFVRVRLHHGGDQSPESIEKYTVYTIETARLMVRPPVETGIIVFDMTDFSMSNMVRSRTSACATLTHAHVLMFDYRTTRPSSS